MKDQILLNQPTKTESFLDLHQEIKMGQELSVSNYEIFTRGESSDFLTLETKCKTFSLTIRANELWERYEERDWLDLLTVKGKQLDFDDCTITNRTDSLQFWIKGENEMKCTLFLPSCESAIRQVAEIVRKLYY
jgi:hypothetical protein